MSYVCTKELSIGCDIMRVGDVIEHVVHDIKLGEPCVTFSIDGVHYAMRPDVFREHFEEVGE